MTRAPSPMIRTIYARLARRVCFDVLDTRRLIRRKRPRAGGVLAEVLRILYLSLFLFLFITLCLSFVGEIANMALSRHKSAHDGAQDVKRTRRNVTKRSSGEITAGNASVDFSRRDEKARINSTFTS